MTENPKVVVMVLRDDGKVLFSKRARAKPHLTGWIPLSAGGNIEPGETVEDAVIREAKEELGLDAKIIRYLGHVKHKDDFLVFECKPIGGELKPDPREIQETRWVPLELANEFSQSILTNKIMKLL